MNRSRDWTIGVSATALVGALIIGCGGESESTSRADVIRVLPGGLAQIDSTLAANKGQWVLVNVWATWCKPCVAETSELVALDQVLGEQNFTLLGLSMDFMVSPTMAEASGKVKTFVAAQSVDYPNIVFSGSTDEIIERFDLPGPIPVSILYDPSGQEVDRWVGRLMSVDVERIRQLVSPA